MNRCWAVALSSMLAIVLFWDAVLAVAKPSADASRLHIQDIYNYLGTLGDELPKDEIAKYCRFLIDCQDPGTGNFHDKSGKGVYSVKAYYLLKQFGYEPRYPLGVCQEPSQNWCQMLDTATVTVRRPDQEPTRAARRQADYCRSDSQPSGPGQGARSIGNREDQRASRSPAQADEGPRVVCSKQSTRSGCSRP